MDERHPHRIRLHSPVIFSVAFAITAVLGLMTTPAYADPLSGSVLDGETLEPIPNARVTLVKAPTTSANSQRNITADAMGRFAFDDIPVGMVEFRIEASGYETALQTVEVPPGGRTDQTLILLRPGAASEIIEVSGDIPPALPPGKTDLRRSELTRIAGTRGDALSSIKNLPGVANADAAGSGPGFLVIRGSAPEDSKVTIDGIQIPTLYHFFGQQSVMPSELISSIDFLPGGFGVEEGRATGGIINIHMRESDVKEIEGFAEVSFINMAAFVRGPISEKHNLRFAVGLRRSFVDLFLSSVLPESAKLQFTTAPQYYDGQVRIDWQPSYRNRVTLLGLASFDLLSLLNDNLNPNEPLLNGKWENENSFSRTFLSWHHTRDKLENRLVGAIGTTGLRFELESPNGLDNRFLRFTERALQLRDDVTWKPSSRITVRAGGEAVFTQIESDVRFPLAPHEGSGGLQNLSNAPIAEFMDTGYNHVAAVYVAADVRPIKPLTITPGVRLDYYHYYGEATVLPRLSVEHALTNNWTTRLAVGMYSRPPQAQEARQETIDPELATQYVLGVDYRIAEGITTQLSGFYTDRSQLIVQDELLAATDPENAYVNRGNGRSFGGELMVRAKFDRFFGWIAYTLSRSDRIDGPDEQRRLFDYDQTHNLIAVASFKLGDWEFGGRWQYNTGSPFTPVDSSLFLSDVNIYIPQFGDVNSDRLKAAHQLDLRVDRKWQFSTWSLSAYLDINNVYANPRVLAFTYNYDFTERRNIEDVPLIPAIGVRGSF